MGLRKLSARIDSYVGTYLPIEGEIQIFEMKITFQEKFISAVDNATQPLD